MMLHEDWNLVVFVFGSRYFLNVMNERIMTPELKKHIEEIFLYELKMGAIDMH